MLSGPNKVEAKKRRMWRYRLPGFELRLLEELQRQKHNSLYCDTLLQTDGLSVPAHSCILAALSPYLSNALSNQSSPLPAGQRWPLKLQAVKAQTLLKLVDLLYSGELEGEGTMEQEEVMAAACKLGIGRLVEGWKDRGREGEGEEERRCSLRDVGVQTEGGETQVGALVEMGTQTVDCNGGIYMTFLSPLPDALPTPLLLVQSSSEGQQHTTHTALPFLSPQIMTPTSHPSSTPPSVKAPVNCGTAPFRTHPQTSEPEVTNLSSSSVVLSGDMVTQGDDSDHPTTPREESAVPECSVAENVVTERRMEKKREQQLTSHTGRAEEGGTGECLERRGVVGRKWLSGQRLENTQISIKVKLRRRTRGQLWELVSGQETDGTISPGQGQETDGTVSPGQGQETDGTVSPGQGQETDGTISPGQRQERDGTISPGRRQLVLAALKKETHDRMRTRQLPRQPLPPPQSPALPWCSNLDTAFLTPPPRSRPQLTSKTTTTQSTSLKHCSSTQQPTPHPTHEPQLALPQPPVEDSDEQIEKMLEDIMMGLNILPPVVLDRDCDQRHHLQSHDRPSACSCSHHPVHARHGAVGSASRCVCSHVPMTGSDDASSTETAFHSITSSHFVTTTTSCTVTPDLYLDPQPLTPHQCSTYHPSTPLSHPHPHFSCNDYSSDWASYCSGVQCSSENAKNHQELLIRFQNSQNQELQNSKSLVFGCGGSSSIMPVHSGSSPRPPHQSLPQSQASLLYAGEEDRDPGFWEGSAQTGVPSTYRDHVCNLSSADCLSSNGDTTPSHVNGDTTPSQVNGGTIPSHMNREPIPSQSPSQASTNQEVPQEEGPSVTPGFLPPSETDASEPQHPACPPDASPWRGLHFPELLSLLSPGSETQPSQSPPPQWEELRLPKCLSPLNSPESLPPPSPAKPFLKSPFRHPVTPFHRIPQLSKLPPWLCCTPRRLQFPLSSMIHSPRSPGNLCESKKFLGLPWESNNNSEQMTDGQYKASISNNSEQMTDGQYKASISNNSEQMTDGQYKASISNNSEQMTDGQYKASISNNSEQMTDGQYKASISNNSEQMTDGQYKASISNNSEQMTDGQYKASISNNARLTGKEDEEERKRKKVATTTTGRRLEKAKAKIREGDETWKPHSNRKRIRVRRKEGLEPEQGRRTETPKAKTERRQEDETWSQHRKRIRVRRTEGLKAEQEQSEDSETPEPPRKKRKRNASTKIEDSPLVRTERVKLNDRTKTENGQVKISLCSVSLSTNNVLASERLGRYLSNTSTKSLSSLGEEANPPPEGRETGNPVRVLRARDRDVKCPPNVWTATGSCSPVKLHQEDKQSNMSSETPSPSFSGFQALAKAVGLLQIPPTPPPKRKRGRPPGKIRPGKKQVSQAGGLFPTSAMTTGIHDAEAVEHKKERGEGEPQGKERGEGEPQGKERGEPRGKKRGEPRGKKGGGGEPQRKKRGEPRGKKGGGGEPQRKKRGESHRTKREGEPQRGKKGEGVPQRKKREEPQRKKNGREPQGKEKGGGEPQGKEKGGDPQVKEKGGDPQVKEKGGDPQVKENGGGEPQGKEKGGGEPQGKEKGGDPQVKEKGGDPQVKEKGGDPQVKENGGGEPQVKENGGGEPQGKENGGGEPQGKENRGGEPQGKEKGGGEPQGKEKGGDPQVKENGGGEPQGKENRGEPQGKDDKRKKCRKRVRLREGHGKGERAELFQRLPELSKSKTVAQKPSSQTTFPSTHEEHVPTNCSGIGTGTILQPQPSGQPQNSSPKRSGETESDRDPLRPPAVKRTPSKGRAPTVCLKKFQELLKHRHQKTRKSTKSKETKESERKLLKPNESDNGQNESRLMNKNTSSSQSLERESAIRPTVDNDHQTSRTESDQPEEKDGGHDSSTCGQETEYQEQIYEETERENVEDGEHFEYTEKVLDGENVDASGDFFKLREELATLSMTRTKDIVDPHLSDKGNKEGRDLVSKENRERETDSSSETKQKTEKGKGSVVEAYRRSVIIQEVEEKMEDGYLEMEISSEELDVVDEVQQTLGYAGAEEVSGEEEEIDVEEMGPTMYPDAAWQEVPGARDVDQVSSTMASFRGITHNHIHLPQKIKMATAAPEMADVSIPTPLEAEPSTLTSRRVTTGSTGSWEPEEEEDVEVDVLEWSPDVRPRVWGAGLEQGVTELTEEDEIDVMGEETD
ncbi:uncharacterized protein LOC109880711 [Oncorhynchus kisutch]|uniref:uncharacterized protein LOC109880711 n=1 Tax=Oncorhynchus kisutch TaxID=8019 RepID=UPI0012DF54C2|nr:uncharacterized protein LOC109880711 [Oncorhynchus kisutch]